MRIKLILPIVVMLSYSLCSAMSENPDQMLYRALRAGDTGLKLTEKAIALGANVNAIYDEPYSRIPVLGVLIERSNCHEIIKAVQLLLESGADIDININTKSGALLALFGVSVLSILGSAKENLKNMEKHKYKLHGYELLKKSLTNVINLLENWQAILKEKEEGIKKEVSVHLLPDISNIVAQYALPIKSKTQANLDIN